MIGAAVGVVSGWGDSQKPYAVDLLHLLLRLGGEGRKNYADRENDREPDPPHGHLGEDVWRESSRREPSAAGGEGGMEGDLDEWK